MTLLKNNSKEDISINEYFDLLYDENRIPDYTFEDVVNNYTLIVERDEIEGLNGVSCGKYNFVASDLPSRAVKYVTFHEAMHSMGETNETRANYKAALKEPLGFIQTIGYSIYFSFKDSTVTDIPCQFGSLWTVFKTYFTEF